ncbi:reverse transcriptase domain-containing protein [Amycolatopsis keratiniphila]|uniref:reverse transcriptase domain-containing protein n=1 Tax=Amycolatopsis keratiniphila TaxID=129921 RepID=UPI001E632386|nr:reverse transcriptase domain-containing protein [Amycolatopsis keratiniphila]
MADAEFGSPAGPGRGRRSQRHSSRVSGSEPVQRGEGIVPAAQAPSTVTHPDALAPASPAAGPQSHSLMPLLSEPRLRRALRKCGRRASTPGADGMTWGRLRSEAHVMLPQLALELAEGTWRPGPVRKVQLPTYTGKQMHTFIPTVRDRLVHRALRTALEPVLEASAFHDWVSGFRPRRNRITALRQAAVHHQAGFRWIADLDVASVSEGATIDEVIDWHAEHIHDGTFLARLRTALAAMPSPIAAGSGLAPLLINLRLSQVDTQLPQLRVVRFADNYAAFAPTREEAHGAFDTISDALLRLRLRPNERKSRIRNDANVEDLFLIGG